PNAKSCALLVGTGRSYGWAGRFGPPIHTCECAMRALELHDRADLEDAPDENGRRLEVGWGAEIQGAHGIDRRDIQRVEQVEFRLNAGTADLDRLGHVQVELVDAITELGVRCYERHG